MKADRLWAATHEFHSWVNSQASHCLIRVNGPREGLPEGECAYEGQRPCIEDDDGVERGVELRSRLRILTEMKESE